MDIVAGGTEIEIIGFSIFSVNFSGLASSST